MKITKFPAPKILFIMAFCLISISNSFGQAVSETQQKDLGSDGPTALEKAMKTMNVNMNLSPLFTATQNKEIIGFVAGESYRYNANQIYGYEYSTGNVALNVIFTGVHSILTHKDEKCKIIVNALGEYTVRDGDFIKKMSPIFNVINMTFNRIKRDFRYGNSLKSATREEIEELDKMVSHYPKEQALEMFNADDMITYPHNLRANAFEGKYTRSRAVVVAKNGLPIFFYFMMTDESVKNFDQYLKDLSGSFMFN